MTVPQDHPDKIPDHSLVESPVGEVHVVRPSILLPYSHEFTSLKGKLRSLCPDAMTSRAIVAMARASSIEWRAYFDRMTCNYSPILPHYLRDPEAGMIEAMCLSDPLPL